MQNQGKKGSYKTYDDDGQEYIASETGDMRPSQHAAVEERIGNHMGDALSAHQAHPNQGVETRKIVLSVNRSLEELEQGQVDILIGAANASVFRRKVLNKETQQVVHMGDTSRSQLTAMTLRMFDSSLPVLVGAKPRSAKGELSLAADDMLKFINGRGYPIIFKADTEVVFSVLPAPHNNGVLLYENANLIEEYIIKTYGGVRIEDLDVGFTPSATEPGMLDFEYAKNPRMVNLIKKHRYDLEKEDPSFNYKRLQKEAGKYKRNTVLIPVGIKEKIKLDVAKHALTVVDEGTGDLAQIGLRLEWPQGPNGSFSGVRSHLMKKLNLDDGAVDVLMHTRHDIIVELLVSAVIPGTEAAEP
jgi:hypothetical protein